MHVYFILSAKSADYEDSLIAYHAENNIQYLFSRVRNMYVATKTTELLVD
jgi:hypothetical protein